MLSYVLDLVMTLGKIGLGILFLVLTLLYFFQNKILYLPGMIIKITI